MPDKNALPVGQIEREDFPRFGVSSYADFTAPVSSEYHFLVSLNDATISITQSDLASLERVEQVSDFHCVTTWCYRDARWSGFRFRDVFEKLIVPQLTPNTAIELFVLRALDKYKSSLLLEDALADDVLLADKLDAQPLSFEHGAPLRIVAPAHLWLQECQTSEQH